MQINKKFLFAAAFVSVLLVIFIQKSNLVSKNPASQTQPESFRIVSTNPDPLEGATILPNQPIEFTFSKPIFRSEFKHSFDPGIEHEIEVIDGRDKEFGSKMRLIFKKPLNLGGGFTLFVYSNTKTEREELGREYIYHFKTIRYTGI